MDNEDQLGENSLGVVVEVDKNLPPHYHGKTIRRLFVTAAILMLITLPLFPELVPQPTALSTLAIILFIVLGGIMSPRHLSIVLGNVIISIGAITIFEYYAVDRYKLVRSPIDLFFLINETLVIIFLFILYYSIKTLRGLYLEREI